MGNRKQLRKAIKKMENGKEKKKTLPEEHLEKLLRKVNYELKHSYK